jgi:RNA polymerase sigma-70 factor, ECF subfamily
MRPASVAVPWRRQVWEERLLQAFADARPELTQTLLRVLGSADDAQDAVQEAFLKCWRHRRRVAEVRNLRAWIFRVGLNTARDLQRNVWRRRARPLAEHVEVGDRARPSPAEQLVHSEALERLRQALGGLRPEERAVFLLRQNSARTYEQIAALRRTPVGTVKTQMRAALHKLRLVLQEGPDRLPGRVPQGA